MNVVICGLSITSSWGNGHAVTFRGLTKALASRGHQVLFLERDVPYYAAQRDLPRPPYGATRLYGTVEELTDRYRDAVRDADLVIVGSFVPDGIRVGEWVLRTARGVTAFYDIDTPVTFSKLQRGECFYLSSSQVPRYGLYLSFTAGPMLGRLRSDFSARLPRALHCSIDPELYQPAEAARRWSLGYMGTYSADRQPALHRLLLDPMRGRPDLRAVVAGPQYPPDLVWPWNVDRIEHLPPQRHVDFYASQKFTLNLTRRDMVWAGYSPSIRLFEAAGCGIPVVTDPWPGLETFFIPGVEILPAHTGSEVRRFIEGVSDDEARKIGARARRRVLAEHSCLRRAEQLEGYVREAHLPRVVA
jgi:spore maturation protein CgeB